MQDRTMKCNSTSLFLLINIKFIPNNMISRRGIHFFLKCYNCINRASFFLLYHLLNFLVLLFNFNLLYFLLYFLFTDKILRLNKRIYPITVWCPDIMWNLVLFLIGFLYNLIKFKSITNLLICFIDPGIQAIPLYIF